MMRFSPVAGTTTPERCKRCGAEITFPELHGPGPGQCSEERLADQERPSEKAVGPFSENGRGKGPEEIKPTAARPVDWQAVDLDAVLRGELLDPPPSILRRTDMEGLIYPGRIHLIYGEPESGKGWLVLAACLEQMDLGQPVLYLDFEDGAATAVSRLQALGATDDQIRNLFIYIRPDTPATTEIVEDIPGIGASLVILDGVTEAMTLHGLELKDNTDVTKFVELLPRPIAKMGAAVVLVDHVAKDRDGRGRFAIGAQAKLAGIDGAAYSIEAIRHFGRGMTGLSRLTVTKDRPGHVRPVALYGKRAGEVHLESENGRVRVRVEPVADTSSESFRPTFLMERVSRFLEMETEPVSLRAILGGVEGNDHALKQAVGTLVQEGYVRQSEGRGRSILNASIKPFRASE